jgi:hypothetical protein
VMIGDRMDTDIVGGLEAGMRTALVLSGVSGRETIERFPYQPDFVFDSVGTIDWDALQAGRSDDGDGAIAPAGGGTPAEPGAAR